MSEKKVMVERRKNPRFNISKMGYVFYNDEKIACVFVNISKEGICFFTKPDLGIDGTFGFEFNDEGTFVKGKAKIIFRADSSESDVYGSKILFMTPYDYVSKYQDE